jgi:hypothetical protein
MMVVLLVLLGFFAVAAGVFLLGLGLPVKDTAFGAAVLVSASVAITGGLILLGLAAAVSELRRVLQTGMRGIRPERWEAERGAGVRWAEPRLNGAGGAGVHAGAALGSAAADVIPTKFDVPEAVERPRRPGREEQPMPDAGNAWASPPPPAFPPAPDAEAEPRWTPASQSPERFDTVRPADYRKPDPQEPEQHADVPPPTPADDGNARLQPVSGEAAGPAAIRPVRILKSGTINDVAYTLFSDGSIEAQTPGGTLHFGSIDEFRKHLETSV